MYLEPTEELNRRTSRVNVSCDDCGKHENKTFQATEKQLQIYGKHLCRECLVNYRQSQKTASGICSECGKTISITPHGLAKNLREHGGEFLCRSCAQRGKEVPESTREKIRDSLSGRRVGNAIRKKISKTMIERGIGPTKACREAPSRRFTGKHHTDEWRRKKSEEMSGRHLSEATRAKMSDSRRRMLAAQGGFTQKTIERLSLATSKQFRDNPTFNTNWKSGRVHSRKLNREVLYRSSYEKYFIENFLEYDEEIIFYQEEPIVVAYTKPDGTPGHYRPDYLVEHSVLGTVLIEIKPEMRIDDEVEAKAEAALGICRKTGWIYLILTEDDLGINIRGERVTDPQPLIQICEHLLALENGVPSSPSLEE